MKGVGNKSAEVEVAEESEPGVEWVLGGSWEGKAENLRNKSEDTSGCSDGKGLARAKWRAEGGGNLRIKGQEARRRGLLVFRG